MAECSINELSRLMQRSHQVLNQMKLLSAKCELTDEDVACFRQNKQSLTSMLTKLQQWSPNLVEKVKRRQAKRRRQKEKRDRRKKVKENAADRERQMDEWMREVKEEEKRKEKIFQQTRRLQDKVSTIERHVSLLAGLEKLAKTRGASLEPATPGLQAKLARLRATVTDQNRNGREARRFLFDVESSPEQPGAEQLLKIRRDWDQYVSTAAGASSIPIGWVTPASNCNHRQEL